jgi:hypothetical protein
MADRRYIVPETPRPDMRLGRHINHDPRSLRYLVQVPAGATPTAFSWDRHIPILDQGNLGSCTANAATGLLGSGPFFATLPADLQATLADPTAAEKWAVGFYSDETKIDPFPGWYDPAKGAEDTGSDGLSAAKVARARGLSSGETHITSLAAANVAGQSGPFIVGTVWLEQMFSPDGSGLVTASGAVAGGHEYLCRSFDPAADRWGFDNSWSETWGVDGRFYMTSKTFASLLVQEGDATSFVPVTAPAPTPTPPPAPTPPAPSPDFPTADVQPWLDHKHDHTLREERAADAVARWLASRR